MKDLNSKIISLAILIVISMSVFAAETVTIGELKYALNGSEAYVTGYVGTPTDVVIPETIESDGQSFRVVRINGRAFQNCSSITSLSTGNNLTSILEFAFYNCTNLQRITLLGVSTLNQDVFSNCSNLKYVDLGNKINKVYASAFSNCTKLTYVVIPASLTYYGSYGWGYSYNDVFSGCTRLQSIIYLGNQTSKCGSNAIVYQPKDFVQWSSTEFDYQGKVPTVTFTNSMPAGFAPTAYDLSTLEKDAGTNTQNVPFTFANDDVSFDVEIPYTYTINPVTLKAKVKNSSRQYGDADPQFSSTYTGFVNNEDESALTSLGNYTTTATAKSDIGTYTIKQSGATAKNYVFEYEDGTLTVTKAPLTAAVNNYTRKYGEANPKFEIKYTGLKNGETAPVWTVEPEISTTATQQSDVDVYEIKAVGGEPKNYEMSGITTGSLSITPVSLTIKANDFSRLYFEDNPEFTLTYTGFVGDDDPSVFTTSPQINTSATKKSKAGEYAIEVSNAASKNYSISFEKGKLTINKRQLTVSTKDYTRAYNEENPSFELSYAGFVNSEDEKVLLSKPKATTNATSSSDVGTYSITIGDGVAENYDFNYVNGKLTIEKAYQTLTWDQVLSDAKRYDQVELKATASSGLEVTYSIEGSRICSLVKTGVKQYIDSYSTGESVISAVQSGNKNYWPTTKQYKQILIKPLTSIRGDVNNDGVVNAADVVTVTNIIMGTE